jgi:hypothetical protein
METKYVFSMRNRRIFGQERPFNAMNNEITAKNQVEYGELKEIAENQESDDGTVG